MAGKKAAAVAEQVVEELGESMTPEETAEFAAEEAGTEKVVAPVVETPAEGVEPAATPDKKGPQSVPFSRFQEVEQRAKEAEKQAKENAEFRERWSRLDERQTLAREAQTRAQQAEEQARQAALRPDPDLDPQGARLWDLEQQNRQLIQNQQAIAGQMQQTQQFTQQSAQDMQFQNWVGTQANFGRTQLTDYDMRIDHARAARVALWSRVFPPEQAKLIAGNEELALVRRAAETGVPLYEIVKYVSDSFGYQPQQPNGAAQQAVVLPSGNQKLTQIAAGQKVQGLGRVQSGESGGQKPWQQMDPAEFKNFVVDIPEDRYLDMLRDPKSGRDFQKRVDALGMVG